MVRKIPELSRVSSEKIPSYDLLARILSVSSKKTLIEGHNDADQVAPSQLSQDEETVDFAGRDGEEKDPETPVNYAGAVPILRTLLDNEVWSMLSRVGDMELFEGSEEAKTEVYDMMRIQVHNMLASKMGEKPVEMVQLNEHMAKPLKVLGMPGTMETPAVGKALDFTTTPNVAVTYKGPCTEPVRGELSGRMHVLEKKRLVTQRNAETPRKIPPPPPPGSPPGSSDYEGKEGKEGKEGEKKGQERQRLPKFK